jgi:phosphoribosylformimino-5-aminoimidazole carboxamide ribotide isomerase
MIAIPAIDVREGTCVQLVGGAYERERVRLDDPCAVARSWAECGFHDLHVVDLDAATGRGANRALVERLLDARAARIQVGGGIRSTEDVARLLERGAARVIVGTRALEDPAWLAATANAFPGRLVVAADVDGRRVATHGWSRDSGRDIADALDALRPLPLAAVLVTAVHREGRLAGPDLALVDAVVGRSSFPIHASGGITTMNDLHALARAGVSAAILGMALYTGALDPRAVATEFAA